MNPTLCVLTFVRFDGRAGRAPGPGMAIPPGMREEQGMWLCQSLLTLKCITRGSIFCFPVDLLVNSNIKLWLSLKKTKSVFGCRSLSEYTNEMNLHISIALLVKPFLFPI